jgi:diadenosine tetraphosphate (Ap4A) HIT family hydrolase
VVHATAQKFGFPATLLREYTHWWLLLRPAQVTLGSMVLVAKSDSTAFGSLDPAAHAELAPITADVEALLKTKIDYQRINYLMLMMVDPHVHFHVFPRYEGVREGAGVSIPDQGWPGPPELASARKLDDLEISGLLCFLSTTGVNHGG